MAHETEEKETNPADPITDVNNTADSEPATPASVYDDPEEEIRRHEESEEKRVEREELKHTQSYATDTSAVTRTTSRASAPVPKKPWYKTPNPLRWGSIPPVPKEREVSREYKAGFLSKLTFHWMAPLMNVGYKRPLEQDDLWLVNPNRRAEKMTTKARESFERRIKKGEKYPLLWALHETFFWEFWFGGFFQLCSSIFQVMSPFTLRYLIQFAQEAWDASQNGQPPPKVGAGIGLVIGVTAMQVLQSLGVNHFIYRGMMIGGQTRARGSSQRLIPYDLDGPDFLHNNSCCPPD